MRVAWKEHTNANICTSNFTMVRIAVFYAGKIVETGTSEQVLRSPSHPYTRSLLNSLPRAGQDRLESIAGSPPDFAQLRGECAFADRCALRGKQCDVEPQLTSMGDGHLVACYRADEVRQLEVGASLSSIGV